MEIETLQAQAKQIEFVKSEVSDLEKQRAAIPTQTRTVRIERSNCIAIGSQFAAKSGSSVTCREIPITEQFYTSDDLGRVNNINSQIAFKNQQIAQQTELLRASIQAFEAKQKADIQAFNENQTTQQAIFEAQNKKADMKKLLALLGIALVIG